MDAVKVLLIEDSQAVATVMRQTLESSVATPFVITVAMSLAEGLLALANSSYDIILLDLSLPDCEGIDAVEQCRVSSPDVPIIVLTGSETMEIPAIAAGAQDYLVKGKFDQEDLIRAITFAITRHQVRSAYALPDAKIKDITGIIDRIHKMGKNRSG